VTERQHEAAEQWLSEPYRGLPADETRLGEVRAQLDETGVAELRDFLTPDAHELLKRQILDLESAAASSEGGSNKKFALKGENLKGTVVDGLAQSRYMLDLANNLLQLKQPIGQDEIVPGINIMRGPGDVTAFHFDGTFLNMILPVVVPKIEGPRRGQLIIYPNIRSFKKSFRDRKIVPALARVPALRRIWKRREVDYQERGAYLFYGYRSLHGVESPTEAGLRAVTNMTVGGKRF
jgi:hypothetical protein